MSATALKMRSPNYKSFEVTAPSAGYTAGEMTKIHDTVGIIMETAALDEKTVLVYSCEKIVVPKDKGVTFDAGDKVYYSAATGKITSTASGNTLCGRALEDGASGDTELEIDLQGSIPA
jgi:hypothetical protein